MRVSRLPGAEGLYPLTLHRRRLRTLTACWRGPRASTAAPACGTKQVCLCASARGAAPLHLLIGAAPRRSGSRRSWPLLHCPLPPRPWWEERPRPRSAFLARLARGGCPEEEAGGPAGAEGAGAPAGPRRRQGAAEKGAGAGAPVLEGAGWGEAASKCVLLVPSQVTLQSGSLTSFYSLQCVATGALAPAWQALLIWARLSACASLLRPQRQASKQASRSVACIETSFPAPPSVSLRQVYASKYPPGVVRSPLQPEETRGLTRSGALPSRAAWEQGRRQQWRQPSLHLVHAAAALAPPHFTWQQPSACGIVVATSQRFMPASPGPALPAPDAPTRSLHLQATSAACCPLRRICWQPAGRDTRRRSRAGARATAAPAAARASGWWSGRAREERACCSRPAGGRYRGGGGQFPGG